MTLNKLWLLSPEDYRLAGERQLSPAFEGQFDRLFRATVDASDTVNVVAADNIVVAETDGSGDVSR